VPQVEVDRLTINYEVQGEGEPLLLIPYTSADHACYAFQLPAYTEHFSCIAIDLPGSGESDKPPGPYSTDGQADQVAAFLGAIGIERAHVAGMSFGAAVGMHLAARHPRRVRSLSLHGGWHATDDYLKIVIEQWRTLASTLPTVAGRERSSLPVAHGCSPTSPLSGDGRGPDSTGRANSRERTFHSLRHTFAKRALESGAQITWLSRHLGHSSLKVTPTSTATGNVLSGSCRRRRWRTPSRSEDQPY